MLELGIGIGIQFGRRPAGPAVVRLPAPENIVVLEDTEATIDVSWDAVTGALGYEYKTTGLWVDVGSDTFITDLAVGYTNGTIQVRAYDAEKGRVGYGSWTLAPTVPVNTVAPAVIGSTSPGATLTCSTGTWSGGGIQSFAYLWYKNGVSTGVTTNTYNVTVDGDEVYCTVSSTNEVGTGGPANSNTVSVVFAATFPEAIIADSPLLFWEFDETSGATIADSSGNGYDGTATDLTLAQASVLPDGYAASFNGTSSRVSIVPSGALASLSGNITFGVLLTAKDDESGNHMIFGGGFDGTAHQFLLREGPSGVIEAGSYYNPTGTLAAVVAASTERFIYERPCYLVARHDGTKWDLYVNGVLTGTTTHAQGALAGTAPLAVGAEVSPGGSAANFATMTVDAAVVFPTALSEERIRAHAEAAGVLDLGLVYAQREFGMFLHFGLETWQNTDYTDGTVDPDVFNPTSMTTAVDQWVSAMVAAGMRYAVLTTKHHSGFCLWPSATTTYDIASSDPYWTNSGNLDIVDEFCTKCRAAGIKPCLYFSVWDRKFEIDNPSPSGAAYTAHTLAQLTELLTNYGEIGAIWFDGWYWNSYYTIIPWQTVYDHIKSLQPDCVVIDNNHLSNRNVTDVIVKEVPAEGTFTEAATLPSEAADTVRNDNFWFWKADESAGYYTAAEIAAERANMNAFNVAFLLNCPPDNTGLLPAALETILYEVGGF